MMGSVTTVLFSSTLRLRSWFSALISCGVGMGCGGGVVVRLGYSSQYDWMRGTGRRPE